MADHDKVDPQRWVWRGLAAFVVVIGWSFILWQNSFHITPPTVFLCIAYFALVSVIYNLFRTGASAARAPEASEEYDDSTWGRPIGALGQLEREKKTLLKAIKEAEFDREMGKLSQVDATQMITQYRLRAIEVIKEIERLAGANAGLTKREQIEREIRARLELEVKPKKGAKQKKEARDKRKQAGATAAKDDDAEDVPKADAPKSDAAAKADASNTTEDVPNSDAAVNADASKSDVPKADVPKADVAAKGDASKADVPSADVVAKADVAKTDVPNADGPKADVAANSDVPKTDVPKADVPKSDAKAARADVSKPDEQPDDVKAEVGT